MSATSFDLAWEKARQLATDFEANKAHYLSPGYQEAEVRRDFIDPFLDALGWKRSRNPYEQEVSVEELVHAGGQRRADYAMFLAPNFRDPKFFVEAKKPYGDIATKENCFQVIRYGWNSETPLAVLTDFEQFQVIDCRYKPDLDTALNRVLKKFHYSDYANKEKFAEIYWLFSREAVADGSLDKRAKELPKPRGKAVQRGLFAGGWQSIDESFLAELDEHRTDLAKAFKNRNPKLDSDQLTEATQRALDRLVFIRFLEDKGIEAQRLVETFVAAGFTPAREGAPVKGATTGAWQKFIAASRRLDGIYNGIVFKDHPILDKPDFRVDDELFADICERLAHVNSPYDFNAIPIHILGSIYERFLGKVIVATDKRVRVEEKPEVRKAGGVYYTPEYIVRYIVANTVGKLIEGKTPDQIAEMRFADIACGSGSFLLGVYDTLLTYHGNYYNQNPGKAKKGDCIERDGKLYLSLKKKREILLNNIYGVDIDAQAVEVCQLSLYLKLLKDETTASAHQYLLDFEQQALLPSLNKNIVCGNSLIGTDILDGQMDMFAGRDEPTARPSAGSRPSAGRTREPRVPTSEEERKLNPMNFEDAFPDVMKRGGFDAIVGNPPYIPIESMSETERDYYQEHYPQLERKYDTSVIFILRALSGLSHRGLLGYISSITWQTGENYSKLREVLFKKAGVYELVNLPFDVFKQAYVDTGVYIIGKQPAKSYRICRIPKKAKVETLTNAQFVEVDSSLVKPPDYKIVLDPSAQKLLLRLNDATRFIPHLPDMLHNPQATIYSSAP